MRPRSRSLIITAIAVVLLGAAGAWYLVSRPGAAPVPTRPAGMVATGVNHHQVVLNWTASTAKAGIAGYVIYRNDVKIGSTSGPTTYTDRTVHSPNTYRYTISAYDTGGHTSDESATTTVNVPGFPDASNTGVPRGTDLSAYTGPSTITACGIIIDSKIINGGITIRAGNGTHSSATPCVTIKNSVIHGLVNDGYAAQNFGPLVLTDDELDAGQQVVDNQTLFEANWYGWRLDIHGGRGGAQCDGFCELHDSYLHDFYFEDSIHYDAFITNGAYGHPILLDHNTLLCRFTNAQTGNGGCSADIGLFADNSAITNVTIKNNLVKANPADEHYCVYTGTDQPNKPFPKGSNNTWTDNSFERGDTGNCGSVSAVNDWSSSNGNKWSGNVWDDGTALDEPGSP